MKRLLVQSVFAFLVLPGTVAFLVPLGLLAPGGIEAFVEPTALIPLGTGVVLLLSCVREFYVAGRGTLAPWAPPVHLVTSGAYRFSRNPMYVAVLLVLSGWGWGFRSTRLALYAVAIMLAFHLRVLLHEEPFLHRTHGAAWLRYQAQVPRWLGLRSPYRGDGRPCQQLDSRTHLFCLRSLCAAKSPRQRCQVALPLALGAYDSGLECSVVNSETNTDVPRAIAWP
jgi:protein-S-isoprenylcysteine O-methyltransferase Ste14